jgi:hypothetical protein
VLESPFTHHLQSHANAQDRTRTRESFFNKGLTTDGGETRHHRRKSSDPGNDQPFRFKSDKGIMGQGHISARMFECFESRVNVA